MKNRSIPVWINYRNSAICGTKKNLKSYIIDYLERYQMDFVTGLQTKKSNNLDVNEDGELDYLYTITIRTNLPNSWKDWDENVVYEQILTKFSNLRRQLREIAIKITENDTKYKNNHTYTCDYQFLIKNKYLYLV